MFRCVTTFLRKRHVERELDDELQASVHLLAEEHMKRGAAPQEAVRLARIELGGMEQVKEEVRKARGLPMLDSLMRDFHHGLRNLVRAPGFSIAVVVTLGLALGANASVLALLDRLVLRPLPVKEPGRLVVVNAPPLPELPSRGGPVVEKIVSSSGGRVGLSYPLYAALRKDVRAFTDVLAETHALAAIEVEGTSVAVNGRLVTGNYFDVLGVKPALGRLLMSGDGEPAAGSPIVLSHGFWQRQFGANPAILNRTIRLNRHPMTVIGVTAQSFTGTAPGAAPDFFCPLHMGGVLMELSPAAKARFRVDSPDLHMYKVIARLAPGMDLERAEQAGDQVYRRLVTETLRFGPSASQARRDSIKGRSEEYRLRLSPGGYASSEQSALSQDLRTPLLLLMVMVALVLVIAAGNVANLFLARGEARSREIAIRFALGASRWRVLRALLVESQLLALAAGCLGLLLARWTTWLAPVVLNLERLPDGVTSAPDLRIGVAVIALSLAAGFCIWIASALRAVGRTTRTGLSAHIQSGVGQTLHWRRALVIVQAALSVVLLCGSALLSRSLVRLMSVDPGYSVDRLYSFWLKPGQAGYDPIRSSAIMMQVFDLLAGVPGVNGVSIATELPLSGTGMATSVNTERISDQGPGEPIDTEIARAGAGHFANLGIALVAGREFARDDIHGAKVTVITEALAQRLFGKSDPIGRRLGIDGGPSEWQVVGILKDIQPGPRVPAKRILYKPYSFQEPSAAGAAFALRVERGVRLNAGMVRATVRRVETAIGLHEFGSMSEQAAQALYRDRMLAWLSLSFALLAALLCAVGIFGLTSFSVAKRMREIGVRIALGATRASIQWMVMKEVFLLAAVGCGLGLVVFLYGGRVLSIVLFELTPGDPASLAMGAVVLVGTAFMAGLLPAYRATLVDPAHTLRQE